MNQKLTTTLIMFLVTLILTINVNAYNYDNYDLSDSRSVNLENSLRISERESFERSISFERIDQYNRLRRNRFLDDSPYYYDRVYYNRGSTIKSRSIDDFSTVSRSSVVRYQKYERYDRSLSIDSSNRESIAYTYRTPIRSNEYRSRTFDNFDSYNGRYYQ